MLPKQKLMVVSYSKKKLPQKRFSKNGISNQLLKFMYLKQKIIAVNRILRSADDHVVKFQSQLNLTCAPHCSHCCKKADIETTALEFLPAAYNLFYPGNTTQFLIALIRNRTVYAFFTIPYLLKNAVDIINSEDYYAGCSDSQKKQKKPAIILLYPVNLSAKQIIFMIFRRDSDMLPKCQIII